MMWNHVEPFQVDVPFPGAFSGVLPVKFVISQRRKGRFCCHVSFVESSRQLDTQSHLLTTFRLQISKDKSSIGRCVYTFLENIFISCIFYKFLQTYFSPSDDFKSVRQHIILTSDMGC